MTYFQLVVFNYIKEFIFNAGLPVLIFVFGLIFLRKNNYIKSAKVFLFSSLVFMFFCFSYTPTLLMNFLLSLEDKRLEYQVKYHKLNTIIQVPSCVYDASGIVVLGSGIDYTGWPGEFGLKRIIGFTQLLENAKNTKDWVQNKTPIVFSGGFTSPRILESEAYILIKYANLIYNNKLSQFNIIKEDKSFNTWENAIRTKEIFTQNNYKRNIILITNTYHMPRAKNSFEIQGFQVCPVSVSANTLYGSGIFNFRNGSNTVILLNEYFGILGYFFRS